ncbi:DUF3997 domain-containing protein [Candidatus Reidiella endopervernicosa]|uniref:DUF3997 domain-containing protein n=1 Tax=Candidatus Reidiella endopervernicosa TaxID=2738883 RepID=A0A6N0HUZ6_9GAMM|nr:DUF3997 domain-containing protein [Candidatus Reidiella endopervernicosa]QKQ26173.1 DUF3997 domain-containing protein [Candidatus Reidiella endopervernicosa]
MRTPTATILLATSLLLGCAVDYEIELPGGYVLYSESRDNQVIASKSGTATSKYIPCNVEAYTHNNTHIVVRQRFSPSCFWKQKNRPTQEEGKTYYWIININNQTIQGPMSYEYFVKIKTNEHPHLE